MSDPAKVCPFKCGPVVDGVCNCGHFSVSTIEDALSDATDDTLYSIAHYLYPTATGEALYDLLARAAGEGGDEHAIWVALRGKCPGCAECKEDER